MRFQDRLGILLSTIDDGISRVKNSVLPQLGNCDVFISHQVTDDKYIIKDSFADNVRYMSQKSLGLSKNRNNCLEQMRNDINLLADDDLEYLPGFEEIVLSAFDNNKDADIITFQIQGRERFKKQRKHNKFSIIKVSSVTIAFRKSSIEKVALRFDEKFGLGAKYPIGEENIFLKDALDAGLKLLANPAVIVRHSHQSSGDEFSDIQIKAKACVLRRMFGPVLSVLFIIYFAFFKRAYHKSTTKYLRLSFQALRSFCV